MNFLISRNDKGEHIIVLVLEPGNIHRLKHGQPILQKLNDFFPDGVPKKLELGIFYSETPVADAKEFMKMSKTGFDERSFENKSRVPHCPECKSTVEQFGVWRNESIMAIVFCPMCGCTFGMLPSELVKDLPKAGG
jgi:hypothetical protein